MHEISNEFAATHKIEHFALQLHSFAALALQCKRIDVFARHDRARNPSLRRLVSEDLYEAARSDRTLQSVTAIEDATPWGKDSTST